MKLGLLSMFLPDALLPLILMGGGIAFMVGAKKVAYSIFVFVAGSIFLPVLLVPLIDLIPAWVLWIIVIYLVFLIPYAAVALLGKLTTPALGRQAASEMTGNIAGTMSIFMLLAPFRAMGAIIRLIRGNR